LVWKGTGKQPDANGYAAIATPFNDRVVELVHAMERGERSPAADELTELVALVG